MKCCKETDCDRRAHSRGFVRLIIGDGVRGGLDSPIRPYVRYDDADEGIPGQ